MRRKYIGKIYDERWQVISFRRNFNEGKHVCDYYTLKNIFNNTEIEVDFSTMRRIDDGATTISRVMAYRLRKSFGSGRKQLNLVRKRERIKL